MFLLKEFLKSFSWSRKKRVGFVMSVLPTPYYGKIMASARLRVYDIINNFDNNPDYFLELYKPWKKYDLVIFQKKFDTKALRLAQKLKKRGVKVLLDINVNYYDTEALSVISTDGTQDHNQVLRFTTIADGVIASTEYIASYVKKLFPEKNVIYIPENITDNFFSVQKKTKGAPETLSLLYVGYSVKAAEILDIQATLQQLKTRYAFEVLLICEKDPGLIIPGVSVRYLPYKQKNIHRLMLAGDIFIAPRDLGQSYNLGHSFTKIGYPMSVGIPVIASKVPSYIGSPALLCENPADWYTNLDLLLSNRDKREMLTREGILYCRENYSKLPITEKYASFFDNILRPDAN